MNFFKNVAIEFKKFALRGSVVDLAVGIIIGAAFNKVVNSLVTDIVLPPIGFILGRVDFSSFYIDLSRSHYASLAEAQKAGVATINYGLFINSLIGFLITAFAVFVLVKFINKLHEKKNTEPNEPSEKDCSFCFMRIKKEAKKCPHCTADLIEMEGK